MSVCARKKQISKLKCVCDEVYFTVCNIMVIFHNRFSMNWLCRRNPYSPKALARNQGIKPLKGDILIFSEMCFVVYYPVCEYMNLLCFFFQGLSHELRES